MDFTNINDPAGVQALLDQLRTSQAWQELKDESAATPSAPSPHANLVYKPDITHSPNSELEQESLPIVSDHITSLLSQLQPGGSTGAQFSTTSSWTRGLEYSRCDIDTGPTPSRDVAAHRNPATIPLPPPLVKDHRSLNFNQALPIIGRLSENREFMEKLDKLQADQVRLERKLWEERTQIIKAQEEKVRVEQAKASIIGVGLSQRDANRLQTSFERELREFDCQQVLTAWDALIAKQQAALEVLNVPSMFATILFAEREKQQRIIQVLEGLSDFTNADIEP